MNTKTELTYTQIGDYFFPDIALPENNQPFGKWEMMYLQYLEEHRPGLHARLLLSGDVSTIVPALNAQAEERLQVLIRQMAEAENVTEKLKADDQMLWVQQMNSIRNRAEEIVMQELIFS